MFPETIVASVLLGFMLGIGFVWLAAVQPLERKLRDIDRARIRLERQRLYRTQVRSGHLGTPYRTETTADALDDNERWSRKAPRLEVLS